MKNRRAVGLLNSMRDKNCRQEPRGARKEDTFWPRLVRKLESRWVREKSRKSGGGDRWFCTSSDCAFKVGEEKGREGGRIYGDIYIWTWSYLFVVSRWIGVDTVMNYQVLYRLYCTSKVVMVWCCCCCLSRRTVHFTQRHPAHSI